MNSYNTDSVSFIMPNYNTINFMLMAYRSIRKYYPTNEIFILDDGSTDGSWDWIQSQVKLDDNLRIWHRESGNEPIGHCVTYDIGINACKGPLASIFHTDMICTNGYLENLVKHWKPKTVVCATRVEPEGIYPPGKEKILKSFGMEWHNFNHDEFNAFAKQEMIDSENKTNPGFFAPWIVHKEDFQLVGGHDFTFRPFPAEDADICLRMALAGYDLIQSRDSIVFHFVSRSHRSWAANGVGNDDSKFKFYQNRAHRNYLRKWGRWMRFDEYQHPITHKVYDVGFILRDVVSVEFLHLVEPWAKAIYTDNPVVTKQYVASEQPTTAVDLSYRIFDSKLAQPRHDIIIEFSEKDFVRGGQENLMILQNLNTMLNEVESNAVYEYGIFKVTTHDVKDHAQELIVVKN